VQEQKGDSIDAERLSSGDKTAEEISSSTRQRLELSGLEDAPSLLFQHVEVASREDFRDTQQLHPTRSNTN
jgi:hypothetical protein